MGEVQVVETNYMPQVKEWNGQRVVTFKDIDIAHGRPDGTASRNFRKNKKHFFEGVDFIRRNSSDTKKEYGIKAPNGLTLITETGYLMIVKSFTDDLSWEVQRNLVNNYFKPRVITQQLPQSDNSVIYDIKELGRPSHGTSVQNGNLTRLQASMGGVISFCITFCCRNYQGSGIWKE